MKLTNPDKRKHHETRLNWIYFIANFVKKKIENKKFSKLEKLFLHEQSSKLGFGDQFRTDKVRIPTQVCKIVKYIKAEFLNMSHRLDCD